MKTDGFFLVHGYLSRRKKKNGGSCQFSLGLVQLIGVRFRCFVEKNIKLTFGYPGETDKLYWRGEKLNRTISNRLEISIAL